MLRQQGVMTVRRGARSGVRHTPLRARREARALERRMVSRELHLSNQFPDRTEPLSLEETGQFIDYSGRAGRVLETRRPNLNGRSAREQILHRIGAGFDTAQAEDGYPYGLCALIHKP